MIDFIRLMLMFWSFTLLILAVVYVFTLYAVGVAALIEFLRDLDERSRK